MFFWILFVLITTGFALGGFTAEGFGDVENLGAIHAFFRFGIFARFFFLACFGGLDAAEVGDYRVVVGIVNVGGDKLGAFEEDIVTKRLKRVRDLHLS